VALPKDLVAASATPLILSILSHKDSYGYDIIQQVRVFSGGELEWADGMLYPILHRLEKKKFIESYWDIAETGRKRKYYRISKSGVKELKQQRTNWEKLSEILNKVKDK
jgi:PadR family transcriptional regulator, regulatory protein PadR